LKPRLKTVILLLVAAALEDIAHAEPRFTQSKRP
jgi:hypothetical protein